MAGFAGTYAAVDGMIAGRGWIASAIVVFGISLTGRIFLGACLFGAVSFIGPAAQATGMDVPSQLLSSLPYIVTIIVLGIISADRRLLKLKASPRWANLLSVSGSSDYVRHRSARAGHRSEVRRFLAPCGR